MPIADVKLVMMALAAVLAAQHYPREVDDWESLRPVRVHGRPGRSHYAWPTSNANANVKLREENHLEGRQQCCP